MDPESLSLSEKLQKDEASENEIERFRQLQQKRTQKILDAGAESLFKVEEISPDILPKARIMESVNCDFCGEPTKMDLLRKMNGKRMCIPCAKQHGFGNDLSESKHS
jgi:formylmethanofuran dehydrogenase subunit E